MGNNKNKTQVDINPFSFNGIGEILKKGYALILLFIGLGAVLGFILSQKDVNPQMEGKGFKQDLFFKATKKSDKIGRYFLQQLENAYDEQDTNILDPEGIFINSIHDLNVKYVGYSVYRVEVEAPNKNVLKKAREEIPDFVKTNSIVTNIIGEADSLLKWEIREIDSVSQQLTQILKTGEAKDGLQGLILSDLNRRKRYKEEKIRELKAPIIEMIDQTKIITIPSKKVPDSTIFSIFMLVGAFVGYGVAFLWVKTNK